MQKHCTFIEKDSILTYRQVPLQEWDEGAACVKVWGKGAESGGGD